MLVKWINFTIKFADKIILLVMVGILKWVLTMCVFIIYLQATEICPTSLRSTGMGALAVFGTASMTVVPYIIDVSSAGIVLRIFRSKGYFTSLAVGSNMQKKPKFYLDKQSVCNVSLRFSRILMSLIIYLL